jgi:hypothetical protein
MAQAYVPNPSGGAGSWFTYEIDKSGTLAGKPGLTAVFGVDDDAGSDTLTIFRTESESSSSFGQLRASFTPSSNLQFNTSIPENFVEPGDILGVVYGTNGVLVEAGTLTGPGVEPGVITLGNRFKPGAAFPAGATFPAGSYVYNLRDVTLTTYWVDTVRHNLMAKVNHLSGIEYDDITLASVIVATGVEDFQVRYVLDDQNPGVGEDGMSLAQLESGRFVKQVNIGLVGRSPQRVSGSNTYQPVNLFNHLAATGVSDGYPRQVVTTMVNLRNY